jgi:predicted nucleic acid-binding protein
VTVAVVLEYESVLRRHCEEMGLSETDADDVIDAICAHAGQHRFYFLWRPIAADPDDDLVLEAAIASRSSFIVTFNERHFPDSAKSGIRCLTPKEFLILMGDLHENDTTSR